METPQLRQPLAIVFCDIAGTSAMMAEVGDLAISTAIGGFYEQAGRLSREHHCASMKFIGDGFLTAFEDPAEAVPLAGAIQDLFRIVPALNGRGLLFRFSLHFAEVLCIETSYGKDVFGEEVNTAARLNDHAEPGQIVISQAALQRLPPAQRSLAGPAETVRIKGAGDVQIHRIGLVTA